MWKRVIALLMTVCLLLSLVVSTFAASKQPGKTAVFLGDSLSLGFSMNGMDTSAAFEYDRCLQQSTDNYYWAYPFQFGELVYGKDPVMYDPNSPLQLLGADYEVHNNIYNYGLSGAMAEDVNVLLREGSEGLKATSTTVNVLRQGFVEACGGSDEEAREFAATLQERVNTADMVAVAVGGNNIYHNFINNGFQSSPEAGAIGMIFSMISSMLQYMTPMTDMVSMLKMYADPDMLKSLLDMMNNPVPDFNGFEDMTLTTAAPEAKQEDEMVTGAALTAPNTDQNDNWLSKLLRSWFGKKSNKVDETTELASGIVKGAMKQVTFAGNSMSERSAYAFPVLSSLEQFLNYYSKQNVYNYYNTPAEGGVSPYKNWEMNYDGIVDYIKKNNHKGQIVLISQYNPFGLENYLTLMRERLADNSIWDDYGKERTTVLRVMRTLITELGVAQRYEITNRGMWAKMVSQAMKKAINTLLPLIGQDNEQYYYMYKMHTEASMWGPEMDYYMVEGSTLSLDEYMAAHPELIDVQPAKFFYMGMGGYNMMYVSDPTVPIIIAAPDENEAKEQYKTMYPSPMFGDPGTCVEIDSDFSAKQENTAIVNYLESMYPGSQYTISDEDSSALYDLLGEIAYPMMIYLVGRGLQGVYDDMNEHMQSLADANPFDNIVYVDISNAPTNGRFDPHPNEFGHTWIAESIYEQLCLINGGTAFRGYRGEGEYGINIDLTRVTFRSIKTMAKAVMDQFNGDGEAGVKGEWAAAITIVQQTQRLSSLLLNRILF